MKQAPRPAGNAHRLLDVSRLCTCVVMKTFLLSYGVAGVTVSLLSSSKGESGVFISTYASFVPLFQPLILVPISYLSESTLVLYGSKTLRELLLTLPAPAVRPDRSAS